MIPNKQEISQKNKGLGLVLEGGAMRGLFSAGIIDVLMENNINPDGVIGVSAGAAFGCNMKSRQPGRCIRYNKRFARDWRYCSLRSLLTTGDLFGGDFCYHQLPKHLDVFDVETFEQNPMEFYAVCTDVDTGQAVYKQLIKADDECYEWIRASASMPIASKIVTIKGQRLLDGGIADSIPLKRFQDMGYHRNIVVLTQPRDFIKMPSRMNAMINLVLRKYPHFIESSNRRHLMYNAELEYVRQQEQKGNILVLAPDEKLPINHVTHDADLMQHVYELGRNHATRRIDEIISFVKK
ncbi:MAG: patatin-like phospholipase family protein [Prevotella sp.]|jgi:predicted patatin/cPLA2 family phospholipase